MKNSEVIKLINISHSFDGRQVLHDLSLSVKYGEKLIFNAPSGFGKSTVFNIIMGFIQPDEGSIEVEGAELNEENVKSIRNKIAFLPQNMMLPNITVEEFVHTIEHFEANTKSGMDMEVLKTLFCELQLPKDVCGAKLGMLSGGEKQRLMLAIVVALKKKILLLDEALSGVDIDRAKIVLNYLSEIEDLSIIFISHDSRHLGVGSFKELEVVHRGG